MTQKLVVSILNKNVFFQKEEETAFDIELQDFP
jgi:hypothetical protein